MMGNLNFVVQFIDQNLDSWLNLEVDHIQSFVASQNWERENQAIKFEVALLHQNLGNLHFGLINPKRTLDTLLQDCGH